MDDTGAKKARFLLGLLGSVVTVVSVLIALAIFLGVVYGIVRFVHWAWYW